MSLDSNIYGSDPTGYAYGIGSEALGAPTPAPTTGSRASEGGSGTEVVSKGEVVVKGCGSGKAPKSKGN